MDEKDKEEFWQDLGRPEEPKYQYAFAIVVHDDGAVSTEIITKETRRKATTFDIYQACKEISSDIESLLLADRVTKSVLAALQNLNPADDVKEKLRSALSERGIETPKA